MTFCNVDETKVVWNDESSFLSCFRMSITIWVMSSHLGLQGLGPDQGESQGRTVWQCCKKESGWE